MKIEIEKKHFAEAEINVEQFKHTLQKTLDLRTAINLSLKVIFIKGNLDEEMLKNLIYLDINWGTIIDQLREKEDDKILIRFFDCRIDDKISYKPGTMNNINNKTILEFSEEKRKEETVFIIHSFINNLDHHLKNLIDRRTYDYTKNGWKKIN